MTHPLSEAGTSVEVKALDWLNRGGLWLSNGGLVEYRVSQPTNADAWRWATNANGPFSDIYPTADEAKAAAQADYEQRILSALIQPTPSETEGDWVLVPREATDEMVLVAYLHGGNFKAGYRAMIEASPTPPPIGDGESDLVARLRAGTPLRDGDMIWEDADHTMREAATAIESLSRQLEEAREALEPFVKAEREIATALFFGNLAYSIVWPDDMPIGLLWNEENPDEAIVSVTWGDFCRAKETVSHG